MNCWVYGINPHLWDTISNVRIIIIIIIIIIMSIGLQKNADVHGQRFKLAFAFLGCCIQCPVNIIINL